MWLTERYGPQINFASVSPHDVVAVDATRRGLHRKGGFPYIFGKRERTSKSQSTAFA